MRAAYVDRLGPAAEIRIGDVADPLPAENEVLVEVALTTVNPVDILVRSGGFRTPLPFPFVIGRDLCGTVLRTGRAVPGFAPGDQVWCNSLGHEGRQGAAAELAAVPAERLYHLPPGVDPAAALAVVHPAATAYLALFTHGRLRRGETVLVAGAAGNVGSAMVSLATEAGARVVTTSHPRDFDFCRSLGAAEVLDYRDPELTAHILAASGGVDLYTDTFGVNDVPAAVALCNRRGRIVVLAGPRSESVLPVGELYLKDCSVRGFVISHATTSELSEAADRINALLTMGELRSRSVEVLALHHAESVHRKLEQGQLRGRRALLRTDGRQ